MRKDVQFVFLSTLSDKNLLRGSTYSFAVLSHPPVTFRELGQGHTNDEKLSGRYHQAKLARGHLRSP